MINGALMFMLLNLPLFLIEKSDAILNLQSSKLFAADEKKTENKDKDEDEDEDENEDDDKKKKSTKKSTKKDDGKEKPEFSFKGKVEYEHFLNTYSQQSFLDANKKMEARAQFKIKYGIEAFYFYSVTNVYLQPSFIHDSLASQNKYSPSLTAYRNLSFSSPSFEVAFQELYLCYMSDVVRIRLGNQVFAWGTADTNNPTSYFSPSDMRELLFRGSDESKIGIPALAFMFFFDKMNLEIVFAPIHVGALNPTPGNFWSINLDNAPINIEYINGQPMAIDFFNFAYGARFSATVKGYDFAFSYYHGPDKNGLAVPSNTVIRSGEPLTVQIVPQYYIMNAFGFDFSTAIDKFTVQLELAYSFDKPALLSQSGSSLTLPMDVTQTHYLSYSVGFNVKIPWKKIFKNHQGESMLTIEWSHSTYFVSSVEMPALPALIVLRYDDSFFESQLTFSFTAMYDVFKGGVVLWPKIGWDFQNSFKIELSYAFMYGVKYSQYTGQSSQETVGGYSADNTLFYYMKDNSLVMLRLKYEF